MAERRSMRWLCWLDMMAGHSFSAYLTEVPTISRLSVESKNVPDFVKG